MPRMSRSRIKGLIVLTLALISLTCWTALASASDASAGPNRAASKLIAAATKAYSFVAGNFAAVMIQDTAPSCTPPPSGMVAWYPGDGNADDIQNGNHGTLQGGAGFSAGKVGQAFSFDGNGDAVSVGNPSALQLQTFTIDAWIRRASATTISFTDDGEIFGYGSGGYVLGFRNDGRVFLSKNGISAVDSGDLRVTDTNFHHVAVTKDGDSVTFYVDGVATSPQSYDPGFTFTTNAAIGAEGGAFAGSFNGLIDEVEIFNRALSQNEIQSIVNADTAGKCKPQCTAAPSGTVAWLPGDGNTNDISGNNNNGTPQGGVTYAPGIVGQAFSLDGVDDYIEVPNAPNLNPTDQITVEAWYKPVSFDGNGNNPIVDKGYLTHSPPFYQYHLGVSGDLYSSNPASFRFDLSVGGNGVSATTGANFWRPGNWYHIVGTYDGAQVKLYVDGVLINSVSASGAMTDYGKNLRIGSFSNLDAYLPGTVDEVTIYNLALTAAEIQSIYNAGTAGKCKGPDLSLTKTHTGNFTVGGTGTYTLTVTNGGVASTSGAITVTDTLPAGLSYVSGTGTGWLCSASGQTITCTNESALGRGASSSITLTVGISNEAVPSVTNTATVANAGDLNPANDMASDTATVDAFIHQSATLGQTGVTNGVVLASTQFLGSRFTVSTTTTVTSIGGHMYLNNGSSFFGVIVRLSGPGALPSGSPFDSTVLASTTFTPPPTSADFSVPLSVTLEPGTYAVIFGSGQFDASGSGAMPANDTNLPGASYFFWNNTAWTNGGFTNARFFVRGENGPVNSAPTAFNDSYSVDENGTLNVSAPGVLGNDSDPDGNTITAVKVSDPTNGTLTLNPNGSFSYTPNANFSGTDSFTYKASDGTADSGVATVSITVNAVNRPPVAADDSFSINEDATLNTTAPGVLANDTDADSDALTAIQVSGPSHGSLGLNSDGSFSYTPAANYNGTDSFSYKANDGTADSNVAAVTVTVTAVNDAPTAVNDAATTNEDTAINISVLSNDIDPDIGDTLSVSSVTQGAHGSVAIITTGPDAGKVSYTPNANFNGTDTFAYKAKDSADPGAESNVATVTITVNAANDVPVAANDSYGVTVNSALNIAAPGVLTNDTDGDNNPLTAILMSSPSHGSLSLSSDGSFTYTPEANFSGTDTFSYRAHDGMADSNVATVTITVTTAAARGKVAVFGAPGNPTWNDDVRNKILGTGLFTQVDAFLVSSGSPVPTLSQLQQYSAVLVYSDSPGFSDNVALGNVLANYMDGGGGVVLATFAFYDSGSLSIQGRIKTAGYLPFTTAQQAQPGGLTLVADLPQHPLLNGVTSFNGGASSFHNSPIATADGATLVAHWSNNQPLVATKKPTRGRIVGLNFFPPSSDARSDFWQSNSDGARLMANALRFASIAVEIKPASPAEVTNCYPFGGNTGYGGMMGFIYRNVPAFTLRPGDQVSFDLGALNNQDNRRNIYFAVANKNPSDSPDGGQDIRATEWIQVVSDNNTPLNPRGNTIIGDYELTYTAEASFNFPGGGLIIGFGGSPPGEYADPDCEQVLVATTGRDASGNFYRRFFGKPFLTLDTLDSSASDSLALGGFVINGASVLETTPTFSISGRITDGNNNGLSGVTVTLSGSQQATKTTDASGNYSFGDLPAGDYTVTPSKANFTFAPTSRTFDDLASNQTDANFTGTLNTFSISGRVTDGNNNGLSGVTVTLSGGRTPITASTDGSGNYTLTGVEAGGNYTVTPSKANFSFVPAIRSFTNLTSDQTGVNFTGMLGTFTISGRVTDAAGTGISGVTVTLSGGKSDTTTTDGSGNYALSGIEAGRNYTVTPSKANFTFTPASQSFSDLSRNQTANFTGTLNTFSISGRVTDGNNNGLSGVTVTLSGSQQATKTTDASGNYSFGDLPAGDYTVTPSKASFSFTPATSTFDDLSANQTANFTARRLRFKISGRVTERGGIGISDVTMTLTPTNGGQTTTTITGGDGSYSFADIEAGSNYTLSPSRPSFEFTPASLSLTNLSGDQVADFTSDSRQTVATPPGSNVTVQTEGVAITFSNVRVGGMTTITEIDPSAAGTPPTGYTLFGDEATIDISTTASFDGPIVVCGQVDEVTDPSLFANVRILHGEGGALIDRTSSSDFSTRTVCATVPSLSPFALAVVQLQSISGRVVDTSGAALRSVTVSLSGSQSASITTDTNGNYTFGGLIAGGSFTVTASETGFNFTPPSQSFTNLRSNQVVNFLASPQNFVITGRVTNAANGQALSGVEVKLTGALTASQTTDNDGRYSFSGVAGGAPYTVTPRLDGFDFNPRRLFFSSLSSDQTGQDFTATAVAQPTPTPPPSDGFNENRGTNNPDPEKFTLGTLTQDTAQAFDPGVTVLQQNGQLQITPRTGADGSSFNGYVGVNPLDLTAVPTVSVQVVQAVGSDGAQTIFALGNDSQNWSRFVVQEGDLPAPNAEFLAAAASSGGPVRPKETTVQLQFQTNIGGTKLSFGIPYNPVLHRFWRFRSEPVRTLVFETSDDGSKWVERYRTETGKGLKALVSELSAGTTRPSQNPGRAIFDDLVVADAVIRRVPVNRIDQVDDFVRQQYLDFLNREPDSEGFEFWRENITSCGGDVGCIEAKRVDTSAAFFLSIEFQETGYLVYRLYQEAYGRRPLREEFIRDVRKIGQGVVIGREGALERLEVNRKAFSEEFVARPAFKERFAGMENGDYVDALYANAGVKPTQEERAVLIIGMLTERETRATVLLKVAENQAFKEKESNRAFVLMQYFGYLQREPDEAGYNFWLGKLNQFGGDFRAAEMVKAFITSKEYRDRFVQP